MTVKKFEKVYGKKPTTRELRQLEGYNPTREGLTDAEIKNLRVKFKSPTLYNMPIEK